MDYLAHGAWAYILFHKSRRVWWAVFFGMFPDTISWLPYFIYRLFTQPLAGKPDLMMIPDWVHILYGISHSLLLCLGIIVITFFIFYKLKKQLPYFILGWPLHIVIDIPTHAQDFLPTPFLWPLSDYVFPGMSWATPWFWILNWVVILTLLGWIWWKRKRP
ncbi:hypothetical protein HYV86_01080 [Candidatus Woesearchaeota archaeon]|nr:hypothetical protein [Candidatus Woesearchaeota archaeon]